MEQYLSCLAQCSLFCDLTEEELKKAFSNIRFNVIKWSRGKVGMLRGARYDHLLLLVEGELSAEIGNLKGKVLKVESLTAPTTIAGPILFSSQNELPVQLVAVKDAVLLSISKIEFVSLLQNNSAVLNRFLNDSGNKISFLSEKIRLLQLTNIRQKIAFYFLDLSRRQGTLAIKLPYTLETLAELFSVSRPSLSRSLGELVDEEILEREGRDYKITDQELLAQLLEE